ncbi:hypothetical protein [Thalassoroseus pseudoceratinae]|uniref:hypothetical protein n=1 Tax=Thalassoroseus pseudoceratinae TaxID=2713176 RepID=UPI001423FEA1|nr:hypothetical protein [Thalassoroseus pseudoceratinae]
MIHSRRLIRFAHLGSLCGLILCGTATAWGQLYTVKPYRGRQPKSVTPPSRPTSTTRVTNTIRGTRTPQTVVSVELLMEAPGTSYEAQRWASQLSKLGYSPQVRTRRSVDEPGVSERNVRGVRKVDVVAVLDRRGRVVLPSAAFTLDNLNEFRSYLDELKKYGQQGDPKGQPLWGLTKTQFGTIFGTLSLEVEQELKNLPLETALGRLNLPEDIPVQISKSARAWLRLQGQDKTTVAQSVAGFSHGTALAIMLREQNLGFRPRRTPSGELELVVEPLNSDAKLWPVGWEPKNAPIETAPILFKLLPVNLQDVGLMDLLATIEAKTNIPMRLDLDGIARQRIDLDEIRVDHPSRTTSWSLLIRRVTAKSGLVRELKIDEGGRPFIWITPMKHGPVGQ